MADVVRGACCRAGNSADIMNCPVAAVEALHKVLEDRSRGFMHMGAARVLLLGAAATQLHSLLRLCCAARGCVAAASARSNVTPLTQ
jgi:hypothetical protein